MLPSLFVLYILDVLSDVFRDVLDVLLDVFRDVLDVLSVVFTKQAE